MCEKVAAPHTCVRRVTCVRGELLCPHACDAGTALCDCVLPIAGLARNGLACGQCKLRGVQVLLTSAPAVTAVQSSKGVLWAAFPAAHSLPMMVPLSADDGASLFVSHQVVSQLAV